MVGGTAVAFLPLLLPTFPKLTYDFRDRARLALKRLREDGRALVDEAEGPALPRFARDRCHALFLSEIKSGHTDGAVRPGSNGR